jgi:hypothetical protein
MDKSNIYIHKIRKYKNTDKIKYNKYLNRLKRLKNIEGSGFFSFLSNTSKKVEIVLNKELNENDYEKNNDLIKKTFINYISTKLENQDILKDINKDIKNIIFKNFYKISIQDAIDNKYIKYIDNLYNIDKAFELINEDRKSVNKNNKKNVELINNYNDVDYDINKIDFNKF